MVKFHGEHLAEFFNSGQWLGASIQYLLRDFWFGAIARKSACTLISRLLSRSVDIVEWPVQRRFAFCTSWKVSEVIQRSTDTRPAFPATKKQQCRNCPQKSTIDIPSLNPPRKLMEEYWFLAPMSRLAISSASLNIFFWDFPLTGQATKSIDEKNYLV